MVKVEIYSKSWCGYCHSAKALLSARNVPFTEYDVDADAERQAEMLQRVPGARTVPQILIDGQAIGGYTDLAALARDGRLDELLNPSSAAASA